MASTLSRGSAIRGPSELALYDLIPADELDSRHLCKGPREEGRIAATRWSEP